MLSKDPHVRPVHSVFFISRAHEIDMEVHEVCKRFLHELAREMSEQAQVIDEHASLVRAHRKLLTEKRSLRQKLLDVQQRRAVVQEELRGARREHKGLSEEQAEASGLSDFLSNLESTLTKATAKRGKGASKFPAPPENLASLAMVVQRNTRNLRFVSGVNLQLQACLRTLNTL